MEGILTFFFGNFNQQRQSVWFKRALYLLVFIKCVYWLCYFDTLFGEHGMIYRSGGYSGFPKYLAFLLYRFPSPKLALTFIVTAQVISIVMLLSRRNFIAVDLLLWLIVENIHFSIYSTLTGGDYLLNQFLFFSAFIATDFRVKGLYHNLYVCLHNAAVVGVIIQVCLVYMVAGLTKVFDPDWISGTAVAKVGLIKHFSLPGVKVGAGLYTFMNYYVIAYQLCFPLLIWIRPIKIPLVIAGILMQLYIGLVMGLPLFALIMVLAYIYFWPQPRAAQN